MTAAHLIYLGFVIELFLSGFWLTGTAITQAFLVVAAAVGLRAVLVRGSVQLYSLSGLMLLYFVWLLIVALKSDVPFTSIMTMATLANLPVMYWVASNTPSFAAVWKYLRIIFFALGVIFSLWSLWQAVNDGWYGSVVGPLYDSNLFAAMINALWFPAAFLFLNSRAHYAKTMLLGIGLFIMSAALFATASRGGIGTWILLLPLLLWASYRNIYARRLLVYLPLIALAAYIFSTLMLQTSVMDRNLALSQDPSVSARLLLWQSAIKMTLAHPFVGSGWGTFASYYPVYRSPLESSTAGFFAHNDYLQMAVEGGVFAMLLLVGLLMMVLLQLKRSLKCAGDEAGLEGVTLLLGVLALLIHASVNFIFYIAFMNILAGFYLARAAQLTYEPRTMTLGSLAKISSPAKNLIVGFSVLFTFMSLLPNLAAEFLNKQSNINAANLVSPGVNAYTVAKYITQLKPESMIAQEIVLRTVESTLADKRFLNRVSISFQRELLHETLQRFETVRSLAADNPKLGARQAKMLMDHHTLLDADTADHVSAYEKAYEVLNANLKADPYHADSIILLSRLYELEGKHADALLVLNQAQHRVFGYIDQQLVKVEMLRLLAAPRVIPELADIEQQLSLLRSGGEVYERSVLEGHLDTEIDARLTVISSQLSSLH